MAAADLPFGAVIAKDFRIVRPLGRGGMGVVYLADQLSTGKRRALKVMQKDVAEDASARERFVQEAKVSAMIESEHVVETIAAGVDAEAGAQWLAMELLDGEDLAAYVRRRGALTAGELFEILEQLCRGLAAAHSMRIVHRDLKPENIFLARRSREPSVLVKILDFGIAKILRVDLTATGAVGTPLWMAPEQSSTHARVAPCTDVWALGLIVFYLVSGRTYWRSSNSAMALMREVLVEPLATASARAAELSPTVSLPPTFDAWFARCVARDPAERFLDAGQTWHALAPILATMPGRTSRVVLGEAAPAATPVAPSPYDPTLPAPPAKEGDDTALDAAPRLRDAFTPPTRTEPRASRAATGAALAAIALAAGLGLVAVRARTAPGHAPAQLTLERPPNPLDAVSGAMVRFDGGTFFMGFDGTPQTAPRHEVTVAPFFLDRTEVTVRAYAACVATGDCSHPYPQAGSNWEVVGRENQPINSVDWAGARGFCAWAGKRLPSEAEWEFAAAGGAAQRRYPWGGAEPGDDVCWRRDAASHGSCDVASSPGDRTPEGIWDLGGNVFEWTESRYCPYADPECVHADVSGIPMRVTRGGHFGGVTPVLMSAWFRSMVPDQGGSMYLGFRCAR